jgi:crossover junction endodeoxyribonuclease RusA
VVIQRPVVLQLPYPLSANRYWRPVPVKGHSMIVPTREALKWKEQIGWMVRAAGVTKPIVGRVHVDIQLYPPRPEDWALRTRKDPECWDDTVRCIDLDNARKVLMDAFNGIVFTDDSRIWKDSGERMEPDGVARTIVTITPLPKRFNPQAQLLEMAQANN